MNASSACRASAIRSTRNRNAGDDARLEQLLDEGRRRARLAGPRRHLDQQLAPPARHFGGQRLDTFDLVVAVDDPADLARGDPPFEVILGIETRDLARVGIRLAIKQPHFFAVRQESERHVELFGVVPPLVLRRNGIGARSLGFERRHGPALPVAEHVVCLRSVRQRVLEKDARAVGQAPAHVLEQGVDLDPRKGFRRDAHTPRCPRMDDLDVHVLEVPDAAGRHHHVACVGDRRDLAISRCHRATGGTPRGGDVRVGARCLAVERQHPVLESVPQHSLDI